MITGCLRGNVWNVQLAILQSLKTFVEYCTVDSLNDEKVRNCILKASFESLQDMKYSAIRSEAADVLNQLKKTGTGTLKPKKKKKSYVIFTHYFFFCS